MRKILAVLACVALCLSMAACNGDNKGSSSKNESSVSSSNVSSTTENSSSEDESSSENDASGSAESMSIEDFIATVQDQVDSMLEGQTGMNLKLEARGNSLAYVYQYTVDVGDAETVAAALKEALESMASTFETAYSALKLAVPDAESVIVEYVDMDGNVLVSQEYK